MVEFYKLIFDSIEKNYFILVEFLPHKIKPIDFTFLL